MPRLGKNSTMTDRIRIELCRKKAENPLLKHKELIAWLEDAHSLKVTQGTISNTLKRSAELLANVDGPNQDAKRHKPVKHPLMEAALAEWFKEYQAQVNISGELIKEKAEFFLTRLYPGAVFEFSNGWLEGFKTRHGIRSFRRFGESGSVNIDAIAEALPRICRVLDQYEWKDIYNMDETGLFYRMQADNSLASEQLEGRKASKERITATVCCNGDGSDKLPLWFIGKFQKPRCFKNVNIENLGCKYQANKNAWMTRSIFLEWLKMFDRRMADRKVLLVMDNCSAHVPLDELPQVIELQNTTVFYLPPNTTSKIQPCDAGIIRNLKAYYRRRFNQKLLADLEDNVRNPEKIDLLSGIRMAVAAWSEDVKPETIANCFKHCKIRTVVGVVMDNATVIDDVEVMEDLRAQICRFRYANPMDIRNLLEYPEEQVVAYTPTEDDIVESILDSVDTADDDSEELPNVSLEEALKAMASLEAFWLKQEGDNMASLISIQKMKDEVEKKRIATLIQTTIPDFFNY